MQKSRNLKFKWNKKHNIHVYRIDNIHKLLSDWYMNYWWVPFCIFFCTKGVDDLAFIFHLVVSVYPQILKSSKYGHFILAIWQNGYTFNMANIFWPIGDHINGVPLKKEVENAWIKKCIALFSYLPIYIAKIKPRKIRTLQNCGIIK